MSYDESQSPARRFGRSRPTLALAAVAATAAAGWFGWQAVDGGGDSVKAPAARSAAPAASPGSDDPRPPVDGGSSPAGSTPDRPLAGKVVVIDPGHNPGNFRHTAEIAEKVRIGPTSKECDTTGTATDAGYAEAAFTLDVSHRLRDLLREAGATVTLTQDDDRPFGPCVDERARIGNRAKADAVVSVHADGSSVGHRGFHVILPGAVKGGGADTSEIVGPSRDLGTRIASDFARETGTKPSNYIGGGTGLDIRTDLGGLNLSTVPKVFLECGNMRDPKDAALLTSTGWRQKAARGLARGIEGYLRGGKS